VEHGTEEKKGEILSKVVLAEPKYGEVWQRVRKDPANWQLSTEEILKMGISEAQ
jgi:pre-mRNA-processing factor 6